MSELPLPKLLKMYVMYMNTGMTAIVPHMFGPPGCGKSTIAQQLADLVGKKLHTVNVSRISPLELEGNDVLNETRDKLHLILARMWADLNDGDVLLLDEFLRGFPEVYNGLLDIITSRQVAGHTLPKVFIIAASNSTVAYDKALEDRLLHLPMPDPRTSFAEDKRLRKLFVETLGLNPNMVENYDTINMMKQVVHPSFNIMYQLGKKKQAISTSYDDEESSRSLRHLIGQATLREVHCEQLNTVIETNNQMCLTQGKPQYMLLLHGSGQIADNYRKKLDTMEKAAAIRGKLTEIQLLNYQLNRQLIEMEEAMKQDEPIEGITTNDDDGLFA